MRNIDEHTITDAVIRSFEGCDNPRLKQILGSLVSHLHDFVREVELTEEEWMQGIRFLTDTGRMCDDKRQEFILLSDTLGVSMLTVALNNAKPASATEATVFGPFHVDDAPQLPAGADLARLLHGSTSGRELIDRGYAEDVTLATALNVSEAVPVLRDGAYHRLAGGS